MNTERCEKRNCWNQGTEEATTQRMYLTERQDTLCPSDVHGTQTQQD